MFGMDFAARGAQELRSRNLDSLAQTGRQVLGCFPRGLADMPKKNPKQTSPKVATKASKELRNKEEGRDEKRVAGSALVQTRPKDK
jgi:hypothetical protein